MTPLRWSRRALADVERLHRFLADTNPDAARRAVRTIRGGVEILARQPRIGHPAEGLDPDFREWLIPFGRSGYLVLYRIASSGVVLLAVRHGREAGFET